MIDVNGIEFNPVLKINELKYTVIYEDEYGDRYVVQNSGGISKKLEARRLELGMSQKAYASHIGISQALYQNWKSGRDITKKKRHYQAIMRAFDCSYDEARMLLGVETEKVKIVLGGKQKRVMVED